MLLANKSIIHKNRTKAKVKIADIIVLSVKEEINIPKDKMALANNINPR